MRQVGSSTTFQRAPWPRIHCFFRSDERGTDGTTRRSGAFLSLFLGSKLFTSINAPLQRHIWFFFPRVEMSERCMRPKLVKYGFTPVTLTSSVSLLPTGSVVWGNEGTLRLHLNLQLFRTLQSSQQRGTSARPRSSFCGARGNHGLLR